MHIYVYTYTKYLAHCQSSIPENSDPFATYNYMQYVSMYVCPVCALCDVLDRCSSLCSVWLYCVHLEEPRPDHHMQMCHRSQNTDTQAHRNTQLPLHTHYNMLCMCMCLCGDFVGTCACNDPRSRCVITGHVLRRSPNFTPPFSVTVPTAVCLIMWRCSIFTEYFLITTLTEQLQSLLAAAMGN